VSRLLFTCWPYDGHVVGPLAIAAAAREQGHEVAIYTGERARAGVERQGFEYFPFRRLDEERADRNMVALETREQGRGPGALQLLRTFRDWLVETIPDQVADIQPIIDEWRPDVVMSDLSMWGPVVILWEATPIPVAGYQTLMGPLIPGPGAPPWGLGMAPPRTGRERATQRAISRTTELFGRGIRKRVDGFRADHGLPPARATFNAFTARLPLYIVGSDPELDYSRKDLPPTVHYVGPCISLPPSDPETADYAAYAITDDDRVIWTEGMDRYLVRDA